MTFLDPKRLTWLPMALDLQRISTLHHQRHWGCGECSLVSGAFSPTGEDVHKYDQTPSSYTQDLKPIPPGKRGGMAEKLSENLLGDACKQPKISGEERKI